MDLNPDVYFTWDTSIYLMGVSAWGHQGRKVTAPKQQHGCLGPREGKGVWIPF